VTARREAAAVAGLVALALFVMAASLVDKSPTIDEGENLWAGWRTLVMADWTVSPHPPLTQVLGAAPLVLAGSSLARPEEVPEPRPLSDLMGGMYFLYYNTLPWPTVLALGRGAAIAATLGMLTIAWAATRRRHGPTAALWALAMLVCFPNLLAFGRLTTTDFGTTAFGVTAMVVLGRYVESPSRGGMVLAGVAVAAALGAKSSAIYHAVVAPLAVLASPGSARVRLGRAAGVLGIALALHAATYGFVYADQWLAGSTVNAVDRAWNGFYLAGEMHTDGWWRYVLASLAFKFPHAHQLACAVAALAIVRGRLARADWPLVIGAATILGGMFAMPINLGARHATPAVAMLVLLAAGQGAMLARYPRARTVAAWALVAWALVATVRTFPHYVAYFNEAAGGPANGHRWLIDTNLDVGQDLGGVVRWAREENAGTIYLAFHGTASPLGYPGFRYRYLPDTYNRYLAPGDPFPNVDGPRYLAVSVTLLKLDGPGYYRWLASRTPVRTIGHTIWIYRMDDSAAARELARTYARSGHPRLAEEERVRALVLEGLGR